MKHYIYIVAYVDTRENDLTMLHFKHQFIEAADEQKAYDIGFLSIFLDTFHRRVNDYVAELPGNP